MKTLLNFASMVLPLAVLLGGCYIVPMDQYGNPIYPLAPTIDGNAVYSRAVSVPSSPKNTGPITISARLYPDSDLAAETGVISGTVTNMLTGKAASTLATREKLIPVRQREFQMIRGAALPVPLAQKVDT